MIKPIRALPEPRLKNAAELHVVTVFCSMLAIGMGVIYAALRIGFGVDWESIGRAIGLSLLLVNFPVRWADRLRGESNGSPWYASPAAGGLVILLLTGLAGTPSLSTSGGVALPLLGFAIAAWTLVVSIKLHGVRFGTAFVVTLVLASLWCAGVIWGTGYTNPLYLENVALHGQPRSIDLFFHSALANMISVYGVPSTGIDGLVGTSYHIGTHWLFGRWSTLLGIQVIEFYQMGYPIIVPAVWFVALATFVHEIRRVRGFFGYSSRLIAIVILCASVVGSLPWPPLAAGGFGVSPFLSESYGFALLVIFYLGGIGFAHAASVKASHSDGVPPGKIGEYALACVVIPIGIVAIGFLKVSTFLLTFPALLYTVVRLRMFRRPHWTICVLLTATLILLCRSIILDPANGDANGHHIVLFSYLDYQLPRQWWPYFFSIHFFWSWVYVMVRLRQEGVTGLVTLRGALKRRSMLDAEIVTLASLASILPGLLLPISLNAFYFSDQLRWVAVPLLLGDVWLLGKLSGWIVEFRSRGWLRFSPTHFLVLFIGVPLLVSFAITLLAWPIAMVRANLMTRNEISVLSGAPQISLQHRLRQGRLFELADDEMLHRGLARTDGGGVMDALKRVSHLPLEERRHAVLYIPKSVPEFWGLYRSAENCNWTGFVAPALAEVAMINGLPPSNCRPLANFSNAYGMSEYRQNPESTQMGISSDSQLCASASKWRFSSVLVLEPERGDAPSAEAHRRFRIRSLRCIDGLRG